MNMLLPRLQNMWSNDLRFNTMSNLKYQRTKFIYI